MKRYKKKDKIFLREFIANGGNCRRDMYCVSCPLYDAAVAIIEQKGYWFHYGLRISRFFCKENISISIARDILNNIYVEETIHQRLKVEE